MNKLFVTKEHYKIIKEILTLPCGVYIFGSRVTGKQKKFSDLDICLKSEEAIPIEVIASLKESFSNSDLPYMVDLIDYQTISPEFRKIIDTTGININDCQPALI